MKKLLSEMNYKEVLAEAKERGLKVSGPKADIIKTIEDYDKGETNVKLEDSVKEQKPVSKKKSNTPFGFQVNR